jgi:putative FmdB family regulatory protein
MPLYEYQCTECGKRVEVLQRISDPPPASCEHCSGAMKRLQSSPAIQFKGSGFYKTDYKSGSASAPASDAKPSADQSESKSTDSKSESKSETKSEAKSETKTESKSPSSE